MVSGYHIVGGLVGLTVDGSIASSYSTGTVSADYQVGGLLGEYKTRGDNVEEVVFFCFWDTETSGQATSWDGTGLTTVEMQTATAYLEAGWDFIEETANGNEDIWWIDEGKDYPRLWWENEGN
jgi:hypothetical protein